MAWHSVLGPRFLVKHREHEILSRYKDMDLVAKVFLEIDASPGQGRAEIPAHLLAIRFALAGQRELVAEVMPDAQPYREFVLLVILADTPASLGDVLDRRMHVREPHEQARQTSAMLGDRLHALPLILSSSRSRAYHITGLTML